MNDVLMPVSPGEFIDRLTILRVRSERTEDPVCRANLRYQLARLEAIAQDHLPDLPALDALRDQLLEINGDLMQVQEDIRALERRGGFGNGFIGLARAICITDDRRAEVKQQINALLGSSQIVERFHAGEGS